MTTITIDEAVSLPKTRYKTVQEFSKAWQKMAFEEHLDARFHLVKNAPKEDFVNL